MTVLGATFLCLLLGAVLALAAEVRVAEPSGNSKMTFSKGGFELDYGHSELGYVMARNKASDKRYKLRIEKGDEKYTYDLNSNDEYEIYPLQLGDGKYKVQLFKQASGNQYAAAAAHTFSVTLTDPNNPYLYPNQYCMYDENSKTVALSLELCDGLTSDAQKVEAVYNYLTKNIVYHYVRATTVEKGYLPNIDAVLNEKMGICFDYAALMACMLRVQGIPTQLVIGNADKTYHAWNNVYLDGKWQHYDATFAATKTKVKQYTQEKVY